MTRKEWQKQKRQTIIKQNLRQSFPKNWHTVLYSFAIIEIVIVAILIAISF